MLDVHPPHESIHGWRDFLLHLFTITIGLLIALGLEGCVEWQHHRHMVHEAEASLHAEIESNAKDMPAAIAGLHKNQAQLKRGIDVLKYIIRTNKQPVDAQMSISSTIQVFDDVSWKTVQSTGALSYMPYAQAEEYSGIYNTQTELYNVEQQAGRDAILSIAPFANMTDKDNLTAEQARDVEPKIEVLQSQLVLVETFMNSLDGEYKKFLAAHPR